MKRLDQGHLHPKLEVQRLIYPAGNRTRASAVGGEHSRKEPFRQLCIAIWKIHCTFEPATWLSPVHELHEHKWTHMNCTICNVGRWTRSTQKIDVRHMQIRVFSVAQSPLWRGLTKVILILKVLRLTCSDQESNPSHRGRKGPLEQLVNSYSEHLLMTYIDLKKI
jgi:hypothetical protein